MYVCICSKVTENDIHQVKQNGASTLDDLKQCLDVANCCGRCAECANRLLSERQTSSKEGLSLACG